MPATPTFNLPYPDDSDPAGLGAAAMAALAAAVEAQLEAMPWGRIDSKSSSSSQTGITSATDLTGLSSTFTAVAGRKYRVSVQVRILQNTSPSAPELIIADGSNTIINRSTRTLTAGSADTATVWAEVEPGAGSVTYKARLTTGLGTVDTMLSSVQKSQLLIEDIGPA